MSHETRGVWAGRVARWQRSGLTATAFAAREGVRAGTLTYWKWKLRQPDRAARNARAATQPPVSFVEVMEPTIVGSDASVEIVLAAGYRVRMPPGAAGETLRAVLDVLEARR
jgi:hypothetical protein